MPSERPDSQASEKEKQSYSNPHAYANCSLLRFHGIVYISSQLTGPLQCCKDELTEGALHTVLCIF